MNSKGWSVADEKKPVDGTEENAEGEAAKTPETELTPEAVPDAVVTEEDDAEKAAEETPEGKDTPDAGDDDSADDTLAEGADTLSGTEDEAAGSAMLDGTVGEDTLGEDTLEAMSTGEDTIGEDTSGDETLETSGDQIHSVGEAVDLDKDSDTVRSYDSDTTSSASAWGAGAGAAGATATSGTTTGATPEPAVREKVVERKGGFVPMLLGGVIAAALGYGASAYQSGSWPFNEAVAPDTFREDTQTALEDQTARIEALAQEVQTATDTANGIDLSGLESSVEELRGSIDAAAGNYDALAQRIEAIEKRPVEESVSPEAMAAYEDELNKLREAIVQQRTEVEEMTQQALAAEANAEETAALSKARAALSEVMTALNSGDPYAEAVSTIQENGVTVPDPLSAPAEEGVPTLAELTEEYPPLAREALTAARQSASEGQSGTDRFATFLTDQVGLRSVTPRSGDSPDAILSRAEAALRGGDLPQTLTELGSLPEAAQAPLSDWMDRARTRADAVAAADGLAQEMNKE